MGGISMMDGDTKPHLWAALLSLQQEALSIQRDAEGQVANRKYMYASLKATNSTVLPRLSHYGLLWTTKPGVDDDGEAVLAYRMMHVESGEQEEGLMKLGVSERFTPQEQGSGITYARRYSLMAYLNLVPTETDDDGAKVRRSTTDQPISERRRRAALVKLNKEFSEGALPLFLGSIAVTNIAEQWTEADLTKIKRGLDKRAAEAAKKEEAGA
jgi:hypothetical protein